MSKTKVKIHIIGAGISGLTAAIQLEQLGYFPVILEATDAVGGRVKTDIIKGYQLDHGFQVLLDAYPKIKSYLDLDALDLQRFLPGAIVYKKGQAQEIGDPLRSRRFLWSALTSSIGSFGDKWKVFKLNQTLKRQSLVTIFAQPETTTLQYLKDFGFSDQIITSFFKPFFSGIFLEPNLETSSRMFCYVYKMFGEGYATLPKSGIGAISEQLLQQLNHTQIEFNTKVDKVTNNNIVLSNGTNLTSDATIIATDATTLLKEAPIKHLEWKSCECLYFEAPKRAIKAPLIGLVADTEALINNLFFHDSLPTTQSGQNSLLSVTVVKQHELSQEALVEQVKSELDQYCGITDLEFLKRYNIPQALPNIADLRYDCEPKDMHIKDNIFVAGDHMLNGSLNAAMIAGETAAVAIDEVLKERLKID